MTEKIKVTHEGWFLFCPVYLPEGCEESPDLAPIPKAGMWWLLDAALMVQQFRNWCLSWLDDDLCGFGMRMRPLKTPKEITIKTDEI